MHDPLIIVDLFAETYALLRRHMSGVTHAASLRHPPGVMLCANWLIGHIVATRANVLVGLLDAPQVWDLAALTRYIPESAAIVDERGCGHFGELLRELERSQNQLSAILAADTPDVLQSVVDEQTLVRSCCSITPTRPITPASSISCASLPARIPKCSRRASMVA